MRDTRVRWDWMLAGASLLLAVGSMVVALTNPELMVRWE